jgi:PhzF family phenazine biosynthesis protein
MNIPYFHIDAFTTEAGHGNPAGVCLLDSWIDDEIMQCIANENNLSETAFLVKKESIYEIRWYTPTSEINLCGHATLASGFAIFNYISPELSEISFKSHLSGELSVRKNNGLHILDFPALPATICKTPSDIIKSFGVEPMETLKADDYLVVFENENQISSINPKFELLNQIDGRGVIVTAKGTKSDFVSRFFCPKYGINEDPVTGSSHCTLIPYWRKKLQKNRLHALQLSARGGELLCEIHDNRVSIGGHAICYMKGMISI